MNIRAWFPLAVWLSVSACGSVPSDSSSAQTQSLGSASYPKAIHFDLEVSGNSVPDLSDERPADFRVSSTTIDEVGRLHVHYGDDELTPPPPIFFQRVLAHELGSKLNGRNLVLTRFDVGFMAQDAELDPEKFAQAASANPNANPIGTIAAAPIIAGIEKWRGSKNMLSVLIAGTVDGKKFLAYTFDNTRGRIDEDDIRGEVGSTMKKAVKKISPLVNP
jgi:hypothetical protein